MPNPTPNELEPVFQDIENNKKLLEKHMDMIYDTRENNLKSKLIEHDSLLKLDNRNLILSKVIEERSDNIKEEVSKKTNEYLNYRRQIQINNFEYSKKIQNILILIFTSIILLASIFIVYFPLIATNFKTPIIIGFFIIWLIIYLYNLYWNRKRKNNDWDEYLWKDLDKKNKNVKLFDFNHNEQREHEEDMAIINNVNLDFSARSEILKKRLNNISNKICNSESEKIKRHQEMLVLEKIKKDMNVTWVDKKCGNTISTNAGGGQYNVDGGGQYNVDGGGQYNVDGGGQYNVDGDSQGNVDGGGQGNVDGDSQGNVGYDSQDNADGGNQNY